MPDAEAPDAGHPPRAPLPRRYAVTYFDPHRHRRCLAEVTRTASAARRLLGWLHDHDGYEAPEIWDLTQDPRGDPAVR